MQMGPWYKLDDYPRYDDRLPDAIMEVIRASAADRRGELLDSALLAYYYERDIWRFRSDGEYMSAGARGAHHGFAGDSIPQMNQIKSAIDTLVSQTLANASTLRVRTANARYEEQRQHEIRSRALMGALASPEAQEAQFMFLRDGLVKRVGYQRTRSMSGRLVLERLQPFRVYYDCRDTIDGEMSQVHVVDLIDRDSFLSWYDGLSSTNDKGTSRQPIPDKASRVEAIKKIAAQTTYVPGDAGAWQGACRYLLDNSTETDARGDRIRVVYSWRKSYRAGKPEGRATITVMGNGHSNGARSIVALDVPFLRDTLPVTHWTPWRADQGICGISLTDLLLPTQLAIDRTFGKMQRMADLYGDHKLVVTSKPTDTVIEAFATRGIQIVYLPNGEEQLPRWIQPHVISQSDMGWLQYLVKQPIAMTGMTQGNLEGRSELGPSASGIARVEEQLISEDRQTSMRSAFGRATIRVGREILNTLDDAVAQDKDFSTTWSVNAQLISRPWSTLTLPNNAYVVDLVPVGVLGQSIGGQVQKLIEYVNLGLLPPEMATRALMSQPDVEAWATTVLAPYKAIEDQLSILTDPNASEEWPAQQPTEDQDLPLAVKLSTLTINQIKAQHGTDETILRVQAYKLAAIRTSEAIAPPAPPPELAAPPAPPV